MLDPCSMTDHFIVHNRLLSNLTSKHTQQGYALISECACVSAGELQAVLAYEHNQWFKCQQQEGNDKLQGLVDPGTAA